MAQTQTTDVRQGLADRAKPKPKTATAAPSASGTTATAQRRIDPSKFLNPAAGYAAYGKGGQPPGRQSGPAPPAPTPPTGQFANQPGAMNYGRPPATMPGGRFGAWAPRPRVAQPVQQAVPQQYQTPPRPMAPQVAQPMQMPVPQQYQTPPRPMMQQPMQPQVAQPMAEPPQQEIARLQHRIAQLQGQTVYNPTPYR